MRSLGEGDSLFLVHNSELSSLLLDSQALYVHLYS